MTPGICPKPEDPRQISYRDRRSVWCEFLLNNYKAMHEAAIAREREITAREDAAKAAAEHDAAATRETAEAVAAAGNELVRAIAARKRTEAELAATPAPVPQENPTP